MKIILSGGYTLGPVTPLLAIHDIIKQKHPEAEFLWIGTKTGPEKELIEKKGIRFKAITSGKARRYFSFWNLIDLIKIKVGFWQSLKIVWQENPDLCISAGGFVSVPLHWAAWLLDVPTWIHQQDAQVAWSNKLMAPFAKIITTAMESSVKDFSKRKTVWLGNPVREEILSGNRDNGLKRFNLKPNLPVVFATGGGTGSMRVNQLIAEAIQHLQGFCQLIHLSGKERPQELVERARKHFDYYQVYQFFTDEMKDAYAVADIVISRGGFGTIAELAALGKPAILIPKPGHQDENVDCLQKQGAVVLVDEKTSDGNYLAKIIKELLADEIKRKQLGRQLNKILPVAEKEKVLEIVEKLLV